MIRICFLIRQLNEGGAQRQLLELVRNMDRRRFRITVLAFYPGGLFWDDFTSILGVRLVSLGKRGPLDCLGFLRRLIAEVRVEQPYALHTILPVPNLAGVLVKAALPGVRLIWGIRSARVAAGNRWWMTWVVGVAERLLSHIPDQIILNSEAGFRFYRARGFLACKMLVIPNGISTESFRHDPEAGASLRREIGISADEFVIGTVGRISPEKGHRVFLQAVAAFVKAGGSARFLCAGGGGPFAESVRREAASLGLEERVIWLGARRDLVRVYNAMDVFTSPSLTEGFPNSICEAMACGVPCVVTDVGDSARIVGETGIAVPPGDPGALAGAWARMLREPRPEWGPSARERIAREFDSSVLADRMGRVLAQTGTAP